MVKNNAPPPWEWTPDKIRQLKSHWELGESATEIARRFGPQATKNMVIGKATRMKLPKRESPIKRTAKPTPPAAPLADLQPSQCRFALGDWKAKPEYFCGHQVKPGSPYCPEHHIRAYRTDLK
jgi:GcrA cell cycle regulator